MDEILEENIENEVVEETIPKYFVVLDENNYFTGKWFTIGLLPNAVEVDSLPPTDDMEKEKSYYLENGMWVFDEEKYNALIAEKEVRKTEAYTKRDIAVLKKKLDTCDYQIIKCTEVVIEMLMVLYPDLELPYDFKTLCEERQGYRDSINTLEESLN